MSDYYVPGAEWCVLFNLKALMGEQCPWHIEPVERFQYRPPNESWKLIKRGLTENQAFNFIEGGLADDWIEQYLYANDIKVPGRQCNEPISKSVRFDVLTRDNFRCQICGASAKDGVRLEVDHKYPKSKGGTNSMDNLWTLCADCNRGKRAKIVPNIILEVNQ